MATAIDPRWPGNSAISLKKMAVFLQLPHAEILPS
jgi:hypothetical protein